MTKAKPTYQELTSALGNLLAAYALIDEILDNLPLSAADKCSQRGSNKTRDQTLKVFDRALRKERFKLFESRENVIVYIREEFLATLGDDLENMRKYERREYSDEDRAEMVKRIADVKKVLESL